MKSRHFSFTGIAQKQIKLCLVNRNCLNKIYDNCLDRLYLEIPYAGKQLSWEVFFNAENCYKTAPDFIFINDHFLEDPDLDVISNNLPSLAKWDVRNSKALLSVIKELLSLYKKEQVSFKYYKSQAIQFM